ncbi:hypothetical protein HYG81_21475 (plasmid) [Natrinema zhouii]|uniref:hypothetical protein n=1 Tax=Natrinema zhouii TaxID=1710539 RepID=UPI001CFF6906|nr:hypothetical protein [Natrinema zhouii]UHQ98148.1 hypothetical protein HYG81_21475 [Natrinema zhouii]
MANSTFSPLLSYFTYGALPRRLFVAIILEGLFVLGSLQFTISGFIKISPTSPFLKLIPFLGTISLLATFFFSWRIARTSYSPFLHRRCVPPFIASGYIIIGIAGTGIGYLVHTVLLNTSVAVGLNEAVFGLSVGSIFGFLILLFLDRYEVNTPRNRVDLESKIQSIQSLRSDIEDDDKAPIKLTKNFESLADSVEKCADLLDESFTEGGHQLSRDMKVWTEAFRTYPEIPQASIVDRSRSPQQQELRKMANEFESIIRRLQRISNDE